MKKLHLIATLTVLATATSAGLQAQPADGPRGGHRRGGPGRGFASPIVRVLDADKNGAISAAELANAPAALQTLDADSDGSVSASELQPPRPANAPTPPADAPRRTRPASPVMLAIDANNDGALSATEIANAQTSLGALDANKDGQLTHDELRPLPPTQE